ncbi:MAG: DUF4190 domain-containing protein [Propionibacteriaceae bacterium]
MTTNTNNSPQPTYYQSAPTNYLQEPSMTTYAPVMSAPVAQDPAKTLGVVGLVLSIFANVIGLVISIVAYRKSRKAGFKNGVAIAGIVIGLLTTIGLLVGGVVAGVAAKSLVDTCSELGSGTHVVNGVTYTCG